MDRRDFLRLMLLSGIAAKSGFLLASCGGSGSREGDGSTNGAEDLPLLIPGNDGLFGYLLSIIGV